MAKVSLHGERLVLRQKHSRQSSPRLKAFQECVGGKMRGASGSRQAIRARFKDAAKSCAMR